MHVKLTWRLVALTASGVLSACNGGAFGPWLRAEGALLEAGPEARMTVAAIEQERQEKIPLLYEFGVLGGVMPLPRVADPDRQQAALASLHPEYWKTITLTGEDYIDAQCNHYIMALYVLDKNRKATLANVNAVQSATVGIMGLAKAAQSTMGIAGISFGLAANLFDTSVSSVLFQLPPGAVASVVNAQRAKYRDDEDPQSSFWLQLNNEEAAVQRLGHYIQYCTPVIIEEQIATILNNTSLDLATNKLVSETKPVVDSPLPAAPHPPPASPPPAQAAPAVAGQPAVAAQAVTPPPTPPPAAPIPLAPAPLNPAEKNAIEQQIVRLAEPTAFVAYKFLPGSLQQRIAERYARASVTPVNVKGALTSWIEAEGDAVTKAEWDAALLKAK